LSSGNNKKNTKEEMFNEQGTINGTYFDYILKITCEKVGHKYNSPIYLLMETSSKPKQEGKETQQ
jgi:hypothetical protein